MVYRIRCSKCDKLIDMGGEEPDVLPEDAIEFNGEIYCKDCIRELVRFGAGDIDDRVADLEQKMEDVREEMGLEKI